MLITFLKQVDKASRQELQDVLQLSKSQTRRTINSLINKNIIVKTGNNTTTKYQLKDKNINQ